MQDRTTFIFLGGEAEIPFRYEHGLILLDGKCGDLDLTIELDSCTWPNSVRGDLVAEKRWPRGGQIKSDGIGGRHITEEAEIPRIQFGNGLVAERLFCLTDPLGGPARPDVMAGARLFRDLAVTVDYSRRIVHFVPLEDFKPPLQGPTCLRFEMDMVKKVLPVLTGEISINQTVSVREVMLDTGNNGTVLVSRDIADELDIHAGKEDVSKVMAGGYGGETGLLQKKIKSLTIGAIELEDLIVYAPENQVGGIFDRPGWINLGNGVLENFTVTWDTMHKAFYLRV